MTYTALFLSARDEQTLSMNIEGKFRIMTYEIHQSSE
jgi:hypothetical protein